ETKLFRESGGWKRLITEPNEEIAAEYRRWLARESDRERAQGTSVVGPHRDDLVLSLDGRPADKFGSRGPPRTAALAPKVAELYWIRELTGDEPLLLLDDVLSELDALRRAALNQLVSTHEQVLLTTTDRPDLPVAAAFTVCAGALTPS